MPKVYIIDANDGQYEIEVDVGQSVMAAAKENGIDGIVGECGGVCSCSTCHVYVDPEWFEQLPEADDLEESMLDVARDPMENSRLSCQVKMTEELDGMVVRLPIAQY